MCDNLCPLSTIWKATQRVRLGFILGQKEKEREASKKTNVIIFDSAEWLVVSIDIE